MFSLEIRKSVKSLSEYGELVNMPKEISNLRKQSELDSQEETHETESQSSSSNSTNKNEKHHEQANLEILLEENYEHET